jgi:hypothetical protein
MTSPVRVHALSDSDSSGAQPATVALGTATALAEREDDLSEREAEFESDETVAPTMVAQDELLVVSDEVSQEHAAEAGAADGEPTDDEAEHAPGVGGGDGSASGHDATEEAVPVPVNLEHEVSSVDPERAPEGTPETETEAVVAAPQAEPTSEVEAAPEAEAASEVEAASEAEAAPEAETEPAAATEAETEAVPEAGAVAATGSADELTRKPVPSGADPAKVETGPLEIIGADGQVRLMTRREAREALETLQKEQKKQKKQKR